MSLLFLPRLDNKSITARILHLLFTLKLFPQTRSLAKEADEIKHHRHPVNDNNAYLLHPYINCQLPAVYNSINAVRMSADYSKSSWVCVWAQPKEERGDETMKSLARNLLSNLPQKETQKEEKKALRGKRGVFTKSAAPLKDTAVFF